MVVGEIVLNSGHKMPALGLGTFALQAPTMDELTAIIVDGIAAGYRHIDTAAMYGQEEAIGRAVAEAVERSLIKSRREIFVTSKLNVNDNHRDLVLPALKETLRITKGGDAYNLRAEDLFHFDVKEVWADMEVRYKLGLAKSIGVSNFSSAKLSKILEFATVPPSVNQVEMNVAWQQQKLVQFCKEKNVHVSAWSPLGANGAVWGSLAVMESPILKEIAASNNKSVAQVALRWIVEEGATPIVKSFNKERMKENLEVFNWKLSGENICKIQKIPQAKGFTGDMFVVQDHGDYNSIKELWDGEI